MRGELQVFCPDAVDTESWYNKSVASARCGCCAICSMSDTSCTRCCRFVRWKNPSQQIGVTGCSFGGYHAVNFALKHPDMVSHCVQHERRVSISTSFWMAITTTTAISTAP